ncbi:MAG TPA: DUF5683 domain-containing protein [Bacteroidales bacterium]|nr:DUF5683 domain-containing protein [Bacteroidales bacterium]
MIRFIAIVCVCLGMGTIAFSQQIRTIDSVSSHTSITTHEHSPKTAALLSTACPGLGQIYNKNYVKLPIVYAGFAALGYGYTYYQKNYKEFKSVYDAYRLPYLEKGETPPANVQLTVFGESGYYPENVREGRDYYRRYRDLTLIGMGTWYVLSILEAYVYAHLYSFDTSDNLSISCVPMYSPTRNTLLSPSVSLKLSF